MSSQTAGVLHCHISINVTPTTSFVLIRMEQNITKYKAKIHCSLYKRQSDCSCYFIFLKTAYNQFQLLSDFVKIIQNLFLFQQIGFPWFLGLGVWLWCRTFVLYVRSMLSKTENKKIQFHFCAQQVVFQYRNNWHFYFPLYFNIKHYLNFHSFIQSTFHFI
jgi:hypothetical protein